MTEEKETIKCSKCGTENNINDKFCQECGSALSSNSQNYKQIEKMPFLFPSILEILIFIILSAIITFCSALFFTAYLIDLSTYNKETVFEQIYSAVSISGTGIGIVIGILFVFILWSVFKFNRLEKRIIETQEMINKKG
jgi:ribosomal protein L37E